ncbi:MAG: hypothetical protein HIU84_03165 [Acidobacteria bacterium]|nr:hypothetical protein [Acidobacteriota bacterium]
MTAGPTPPLDLDVDPVRSTTIPSADMHKLVRPFMSFTAQLRRRAGVFVLWSSGVSAYFPHRGEEILSVDV